MPAGGARDSLRILTARGLRAFGDGCVSLLVPIYLLQLGFSALEIGAIVTSTLIGTALVTLWAGMVAAALAARRRVADDRDRRRVRDDDGLLAVVAHRLCRHDEPDLG